MEDPLYGKSAERALWRQMDEAQQIADIFQPQIMVATRDRASSVRVRSSLRDQTSVAKGPKIEGLDEMLCNQKQTSYCKRRIANLCIMVRPGN